MIVKIIKKKDFITLRFYFCLDIYFKEKMVLVAPIDSFVEVQFNFRDILLM